MDADYAPESDSGTGGGHLPPDFHRTENSKKSRTSSKNFASLKRGSNVLF